MIEGEFNSMKHWRYELHVSARQSSTVICAITGWWRKSTHQSHSLISVHLHQLHQVRTAQCQNGW